MMYASSGLNLEETYREAKKMDFSFFAYSAIMALFAHFSRAVRWRYLIQSFGYFPKIKNVFLSVLFMYFSNLIIPRSGEVARCGTLYKYEKIPVKSLLGTVVIERIFDLLTLAIGTLILVVSQFSIVKQIYFESKLPSLVQKLSNPIYWIALFSILTLVFIAIYAFRKKIVKNKIIIKLIDFKGELVDGLKKAMALKQKVAFIGHTIFIWIMYYWMMYICLSAYEPTAHLGLDAGLAIFILGSFGMVAPTNGGIGAWHFMVITAAGAYGIINTEAAAIANVSFAVMTSTVIMFGTVAFILLPFLNRKDKETKGDVN